MFLFQQSEATAAQRRVYLHLVDATDGITAETGEAAGQSQISTNGAGFGNTSATLTAVGNGLYYIELTAGELGTVGVIAIRYKSAATAEAQVLAQVVPWDPYDAVRLGMTALPNAAAEAAGGLYTRGSGAGQINQAANGQIDTNVAVMAAGVVTAAAVANGAIDAATFAAGAIDAAAIAANAIDADALAADVTTELQTGLATSAALALVQTDTDDIQTRLPAALVGGRIDASVGAMAANVLTATAIAADAITAAKIATDAIGSDEFAQAAADKVFGASGATLAELAVAAPPATPTPRQAMMMPYMWLRNKLIVTATTKTAHNDAGTAIFSKALTDDGAGTYTESEAA